MGAYLGLSHEGGRWWQSLMNDFICVLKKKEREKGGKNLTQQHGGSLPAPQPRVSMGTWVQTINRSVGRAEEGRRGAWALLRVCFVPHREPRCQGVGRRQKGKGQLKLQPHPKQGRQGWSSVLGSAPG